MKLSICMMVKDEEKNLTRCLDSLQSLREAVESELIIVDTGSQDNTVEIAKRYTDRVYFHPWNHHFSEMRNITINYATGEWILIIDADEEIEDAKELIEFLSSKVSQQHNGGTVMVKNFTMLEVDKDATSSKLISPRLFKNDGYFCYEGSIHNAPRFRGVLADLKTVFLHYGYISTDTELMEKKFQRTSALLKAELEKDPEHLYYRFQLSVSYKMHNDFKQALEEIRKAYAVIENKGLDPNQYLYVYQQLVICNLDNNDFDTAEHFCLEGIGYEPEYIDLYFWLAKLKGKKQDYSGAIGYYNTYLELCRDYESLPVRRNGMLTFYTLAKTEEAYCDLAIVYYEMKEFREALDWVKRVESASLLGKVTELITELCFKTGWYWELRKFYEERMLPESEEKVNDFLVKTEQKYRNLGFEGQLAYAREFATDHDHYAALNRVREAYLAGKPETVQIIQSLMDEINLNGTSDFYGDAIYFFMALKHSVTDILAPVTEDNIVHYFNYLQAAHADLPVVLEQYWQDSKVGKLSGTAAAQETTDVRDDLGEARTCKLLWRFLLTLAPENEHYGEVFKDYIKSGTDYLTNVYQVLNEKNDILLHNREEKFFLYMHLAQQSLNEGDEADYVRLLRKALQAYPMMTKGVDLLLREFQESYREIQGSEKQEFEQYKRQVKQTLEALVLDGQLEQAQEIIREYEELVLEDPEIDSIKAAILLQEGDTSGAEAVLHHGLKLDPNNFDLLYNLGFILEGREVYNEAEIVYKRARTLGLTQESLELIDEAIARIEKLNPKEFDEKIKGESSQERISAKVNIEKVMPQSKGPEKQRLAFFVKKGMDSFLDDIIVGLSHYYETRKFIITDLGQIDSGMQWADICWFEWCDELVGYGSKLEWAKNRVIICRLHRYEVFTDYPANVNWKNVDKLIVVAEHLSQLLRTQFPQTREVEIITIKNGVDLAKFMFLERHTGFNLSYIGYIHARKNPSLLLQIIERLVKIDKRYKLFVAGEFQDRMVMAYWEYQVRKMDLQEHVIFDGWQKDIGNWLKDKNYVLSTSMHESFGYGIAEAMVCGIKPVIHNFAWADEVWAEAYLFNSIEEAVTMIVSGDYNSFEYNDFVKKNYSLDLQLHCLKSLLGGIIEPEKKTLGEFSYSDYWNQRLNNMFDIEGVGYIGLGKVYNEYLYRSRIEMLSYLAKSLFGSLNNKNVLEVGPGIGMFTQQFSNQKIKGYYGIDISAKAVQHLSDRYKRFYFTHGDVSDPTKYPTEFKADLVFAAAVLLHITDELNFVRTIKNLVSVLQPNGHMIFMEPISTTGATSLSEHVVIRSYEFMEKVLNEQGLEIVGCLPITFFMNFPFDQKLIGDKGDSAIEAFNAIGKFIEYTKENTVQQDYVSRYLYIMDKICLLKYKMGLSEKALIIRKKSHDDKPNLQTENVWSLKQLNQQKQRLFKELLDQKDLLGSKLVSDTLSSVYRLLPDDDTELTFEYLRRTLGEFSPYNERYASEFVLEGSKIRIGKRERVTKDIELIEGILSNSYGKQLLLEGIWHQVNTNEFFLPKYLNNSCNRDYYLQLVKKLSTLELNFSNGIAGFIYDQDIAKDVERNIDAYMWERGIPATQFMPVLQYLKIIERYKFASQFIRKSDFVLEAGAGYGYGAAYLSSLCRKVEALDKAKDNIEFGTKTYNFSNIQWTEGDVTELPYGNSSIDVYVSFETLEHLTEEMVSLYFREAVRVLKKRGKMIISTPNRTVRQEIKNPFHIKEYNFAEFDALLKPFFKDIEYYSVKAFKVERNIDPTAFNLLAVCTK